MNTVSQKQQQQQYWRKKRKKTVKNRTREDAFLRSDRDEGNDLINRQEEMRERERERERSSVEEREIETRMQENGRERIEADDARAAVCPGGYQYQNIPGKPATRLIFKMSEPNRRFSPKRRRTALRTEPEVLSRKKKNRTTTLHSTLCAPALAGY